MWANKVLLCSNELKYNENMNAVNNYKNKSRLIPCTKSQDEVKDL